MPDTTKNTSDILKEKKIQLLQDNLTNNLIIDQTDHTRKSRPYTYEELVLLKHPDN
tara:strand:- start:6930 stop:7097 length:168 start_codon:yes stop_codon:yes gene_type:complete